MDHNTVIYSDCRGVILLSLRRSSFAHNSLLAESKPISGCGCASVFRLFNLLFTDGLVEGVLTRFVAIVGDLECLIAEQTIAQLGCRHPRETGHIDGRDFIFSWR